MGGSQVRRTARTVYKMGAGRLPNHRILIKCGVTPFFLVKRPFHKGVTLPHFTRLFYSGGGWNPTPSQTIALHNARHAEPDWPACQQQGTVIKPNPSGPPPHSAP